MRARENLTRRRTLRPSAYRTLFPRILSLLVLIGLVLAPAGMPAPAMAAGPTMAAMSTDMRAAGHPCAEKQAPAGEQAPDDCCATAGNFIPGAAGAIAAHLGGPRTVRPLAAVRGQRGLEPEADPPPPRSS